NYDDPDYVTSNPVVQQGLTWQGVKWAFLNLHGQATYWHPVTWLSHMLDCQLFGLNPTGHHLMNLLFHSANVLLLFLLLQQLTGGFWSSAFVAALFAIHPLQVDTVAWITERKNLLSGIFWMLTLLAYLRYVRKPGVRRYALLLLLFIIGLMCKPVLVALPGAMLLLDIWPLRRWSWARRNLPEVSAPTPAQQAAPLKLSALLLEKAPLVLLAIASTALTVISHEGLGITQQSHGLPFELRMENAFVSYARYLGKFLWPSHLAVLYPHPGKWPEAVAWGSFLLLAILTLIAIWHFRRRPFLAIGWFWFVGVMLPVSGLLQIGVQAMADRFMYLPIIGLLIALTWWVNELIAGWNGTARTKLISAGLALAACAALSCIQLGYWKNSISLWEHTIAVTPANALAHNDLAYALYQAGQFDEALNEATEAARIRPDFAEPRLQMGMILEAKGQADDAIAYYRQALGIHPNWPLARKRLGDALAKLGNSEEAIAQYEAFLQMVPDVVEVHLRLAELLSREGKTAEAVGHYREALRLNPNEPNALNNLAWILATNARTDIRNGKEAVALAQHACELTQRKQPLFIGTLAAAHAENGQFDEAVRAANDAASVARAAGLTELAQTNEQLGKLYGENKAFREGIVR
ncbi:MAG TPA: tetratricopeptide repeat protein, partial [Verrucomicrobiae bacterium]|nr:tetratricopeptide repeat protein [Verrucomicrobiae bacterium]